MDNEIVDQLKSLHTAAIDARNGYQEALRDADGKGMTPLFRDMIALHESNASELARELQSIGEKSDDQGSFMSVVHQTIMDARSLFNGLDESVLPGLIDGEQRNVSKYDDALKTNLPAELASLLTAQRGRIAKKITQMKAQNASSTQSA